MKKKLIKTLLKEFDKDREIIIKNLMEYMDVVSLSAESKHKKVTLTIKYEEK